MCAEESVHVVYDVINSFVQENTLEDEDPSFKNKHTALEDESKVKDLEQSKEITATPPRDLPKEWRTQRDLSFDNIIGEISKGVSTHSRLKILCINMIFFS